jgi:glycosyltransferase involved in cell wall biosynthesis
MTASRPLKVLMANTTQSRGGAARAMQRIAAALRLEGADVQFAVLEPQGPGAHRAPSLSHRIPSIGNALDRAPVLAYRGGPKLFRALNFSPAWRQRDSSGFVNAIEADVVHLHWVNYGFLSPEGIASLRAPVVWTMHDMWPFSGGCHYAGACMRYTAGCGSCPVLQSGSARDLSSSLWHRKERAWRGKPFHVVSPSRWLAEAASAPGSLFTRRPISVIPNPIDLERFSPGDRAAARRRFGLPADAPIVLFGADRALDNPLKGFAHLRSALRLLAATPGATLPTLVVFGAGEEQRAHVGLDLPAHLLGRLSSEADIADVYRAADLFVLPSSQDNLPNTVVEALSCGTPVCAFRIGGIPDMVVDGVNGFLAAPFDDDALARGIAAGLEASRSGPAFRDAARARAELLFDPRTVAKAYLAVFREAIAANGLRA